jgi:asparagine synthase (glutamine-hydrolysing)
MCGIFGIVAADGQELAPEAAQPMLEALRHRGPDSHGLHREPGAQIGMTRLAIVDLATGDQPIYNEDRSLLIVYNGETYNHALLRRELEDRGHVFSTRSDAETVLHAYEQWGARCLQRLNGMFAFAVWDTARRRLFLARDRLGIKPLYLAELPWGMAFASEAKALLPLLPGGGRPDWTALYRFFSFGYVPSPQSPFAGIRKLAPGHHLVFAQGRPRITRWWTPRYGGGPAMEFEEARRELLSRLERAVGLELMSDVPVGVFLSGGLDSSAVAYFAARAGQRMHSFALSFTEATHDESQDALQVAERLRLNHHQLTFDRPRLERSLWEVAECLDEPFGDSTVLPLLALSRFARERVKVVLTGWGGDEIFAGYPTYRAHRLARIYRRLPGWLTRGLIPALINRLPVSDRYMSFEFKAKRFVKGVDLPPELQHFLWMGYFDDQEKQRLLRPEVLRQVEGDTLEPVRRVMSELEGEDLVSRIMHLDALFFLEGNGLFQADRMMMAASLEGRVPLLNLELLEFINPLPWWVKMRRGRPKELLRRAMNGILPPAILNKPKKGFGPPSAIWVREVFGDLLEELCAPRRLEAQGVFNPAEVGRLLREHRRRRADHGRKLWALLSFQLWYSRFISDGGRG